MVDAGWGRGKEAGVGGAEELELFEEAAGLEGDVFSSSMLSLSLIKSINESKRSKRLIFQQNLKQITLTFTFDDIREGGRRAIA